MLNCTSAPKSPRCRRPPFSVNLSGVTAGGARITLETCAVDIVAGQRRRRGPSSRYRSLNVSKNSPRVVSRAWHRTPTLSTVAADSPLSSLPTNVRWTPAAAASSSCVRPRRCRNSRIRLPTACRSCFLAASIARNASRLYHTVRHHRNSISSRVAFPPGLKRGRIT